MNDELAAIFDRIANGQFTESDVVSLWQFLESGDREVKAQFAKFNVNIGKGKDIHIGDKFYQKSNQDDHIILQAYFNIFSKHINILSTFKGFHDQLHRLEFEFYNPIIPETKRFPSDETIELLTEYGLTLRSIIDSLKNISNSEVSIIEDQLISELEEIHKKFCMSLKESNNKFLLQAIRLLARILNIHPSRINTCINVQAQSLHLIDLKKLSKEVFQDLENPSPTSELVEHLEEIYKMYNDLKMMIKTHDSWQVVDIEFRQIENNIGSCIEELREDWNYLKNKVHIACNDLDNCPNDFTIHSNELDNSINDTLANPKNIRKSFRLCRRSISYHFYQIDIDLKRKCNELQKINESFLSYLRKSS